MTRDVGFQVGVRRTLAVPPDEAWSFVTSPEGVAHWLGEAIELPRAPGATYQLRDGARGELRVREPGSHIRLTWQPPGWPRHSTIQVRVTESGSRSVVTFHQEHLPGPAERAERKAFFLRALERIERRLIESEEIHDRER